MNVIIVNKIYRFDHFFLKKEGMYYNLFNVINKVKILLYIMQSNGIKTVR